MRKKICKLLITGGCGFIGSAFTRQAITSGYKVVVVDKITYAGDEARLRDFKGKYKFYKTDICNEKKISEIVKNEKPDVIIHFAAETHVDRSILDARAFIDTNVSGTQNLINVSRKFKISKFVHISTDEIYGDSKSGTFTETSQLKPSNPYSATKAAADMLVKAAIRTYNFPAIIIRPSNNYGPWQYPEKLVPVVILKALNNQKVPVYGVGAQIREWLFVEDCARGIRLILKKGKIGEAYNIGSYFEKKNLDTVKRILKEVGKPEDLIKFVQDRPGHDFRYSLNCEKVRKLGWRPKVNFESGIKETVKWYLDNLGWTKNKLTVLQKYWKLVYQKKGSKQ